MDLISRQDAIEIIQSMYPGMPRIPWMRKDWQKRYDPYIRTENAIRKLPTAQPEKDIIHLQKEQAYMQGWADRQATMLKEYIADECIEKIAGAVVRKLRGEKTWRI